jgi:hypothetical protein
MKSPIFIFSLPRAGSTLLQRVLMSHKEIASLAEPWLLLPVLYAQKQYGTLAEYEHASAYSAMNDFKNNLPNKEKDFNEELRKFISSLYKKQCRNGETYFLDKTPRYYLIIPEIAKLFPDAKFIFLFRNPVQVMSSMMETWFNGTFKGMHGINIDLKEGPEKLSEGYQLLKEKAYALQYEQFITSPHKYTAEICSYLNIPFDLDMLNNFSKQDTKGSMGDPTGTKKYKTIETESLKKWTKTFDSKYRITQVKKYINQLDEAHLNTQGYNKIELINSLNSRHPTKNISIKDYFDIRRWKLNVRYNFKIFRLIKTSKWDKNKYLFFIKGTVKYVFNKFG